MFYTTHTYWFCKINVLMLQIVKIIFQWNSSVTWELKNMMLCFCRYSVSEKENQNMKTDHEQELRAVKNKHEANVEFLKQEKNLQAVKVSSQCPQQNALLSSYRYVWDLEWDCESRNYYALFSFQCGVLKCKLYSHQTAWYGGSTESQQGDTLGVGKVSANTYPQKALRKI